VLPLEITSYDPAQGKIRRTRDPRDHRIKMSREPVRGGNLNHRFDIFSFATVLSEMPADPAIPPGSNPSLEKLRSQ